MLELYNNSFKKFCDADKYEELQMVTDSLYMALSDAKLEEVVLPEKRYKWNAMRSRDCTDTFTTNATGYFFSGICCKKYKKRDRKEPSLFKEDYRCTEMLCLCSKKYCCNDQKGDKNKFSCKRLNKPTLEDCDDGPLSKYCNVVDESVNVISSNRGFWTIQHGVATKEQTKKKMSFFTP